ncbi:hypothetical protein [Klenkia taihuensis]|uniref:Uncharacterized protein n=1 Tax=Klenkia taihuensis TaxID=1225127 RepID=A0A1I1KN33_9ACTN|nr:hypothetical protein [Klenkia taihuensis]GHE10188.1 hypothetical protein GCM10011381_18080 [Klenkia taihuensis]SFC62177.1 hypothetical protein SAMN05661030_1476 [Klenkia taihuensis]
MNGLAGGPAGAYGAAMVTALVVLVVALLAALVLRGLRRRRAGWYATAADRPAADARGAVNRNAWMLGGGGGGGGG